MIDNEFAAALADIRNAMSKPSKSGYVILTAREETARTIFTALERCAAPSPRQDDKPFFQSMEVVKAISKRDQTALTEATIKHKASERAKALAALEEASEYFSNEEFETIRAVLSDNAQGGG